MTHQFYTHQTICSTAGAQEDGTVAILMSVVRALRSEQFVLWTFIVMSGDAQ